jgi:hypothetical protein
MFVPFVAKVPAIICLGSSGLTAKLGSEFCAVSSLLPDGIMSVILRYFRAARVGAAATGADDNKALVDRGRKGSVNPLLISDPELSVCSPAEPIVPVSEVKVLFTPWEGVDLRSAVIDAEDPITPGVSGCKGRVNGPVSKEAGRIEALE